jgi:hypothetical protein
VPYRLSVDPEAGEEVTVEEDQAQFEAEVQIGKTWRYIDRKGKAIIDGGRLTLRKGKGDVIAEAPLSEVWTDIVRGSINIWVGGDRYILTPLRISRAYEGRADGAATNLARDLGRLKASKELGAQFVAVVEAEGGHVGKPEG